MKTFETNLSWMQYFWSCVWLQLCVYLRDQLKFFVCLLLQLLLWIWPRIQLQFDTCSDSDNRSDSHPDSDSNSNDMSDSQSNSNLIFMSAFNSNSMADSSNAMSDSWSNSNPISMSASDSQTQILSLIMVSNQSLTATTVITNDEIYLNEISLHIQLWKVKNAKSQYASFNFAIFRSSLWCLMQFYNISFCFIIYHPVIRVLFLKI